MAGYNVKEFAAELGFTGDRAAERYGKYERGIREPDLKTWIKIHQTLRVSLDFLISGEPRSRRELQS
jgi:transcriptional regulator with XRE-family HTH domain